MDKLRTPDDRFANLPGYPFSPHYADVDDTDGGTLRIHYVDEGEGHPILMLHGEPSWSYLYRKMVPVFVEAGFRAVAPDLPGFGRSDKPAKRTDYSYERHVAWMANFIEAIDLRDVTLVGQDWGGLIGLRLVAEHPERFSAVVAANTFLPRGESAGEAFLRWQEFSQTVPELHVGGIVKGATTTELSPEVVAAYDAPFPDESFKEGARQFPLLVPTGPDDPAIPANLKAWEVLQKWEKPFLTAFSDQDPITRGGDRALQAAIPGAKGQPHTTIEGGGHFLQEDRGPELAKVIVDWLQTH
jgi:haloalkane dehalogenase